MIEKSWYKSKACTIYDKNFPLSVAAIMSLSNLCVGSQGGMSVCIR